MFRTAELGRTVSKDDFHEAAPLLRAELLEIQQQLRDAPFPVIIVFGGVDGAGKSETVNLLNEWLDPRWLSTRAYGKPSDEMEERPEYWRYWRDLPPKGRIGIFLSCWYSRPLLDRVYEKTTDAEFDEALDEVNTFEKELADDGALILKFWMHLGKKQQKERLRSLEKDPLTRWRVTQVDWDHWHMYDKFISAAERNIMRTSSAHSQWQIVEGLDKRYRSLTVATTILESIRKHLKRTKVQRRMIKALEKRSPSASSSASEPGPGSVLVSAETGGDDAPDGVVIPLSKVTILNHLDMSLTIATKDYRKELEKYQGKLNQAQRRARELGISTVLVFEGWDAAGKGGAIRRTTAALDARDYQVIPIAAPTDEERAQHYLWRFWRHLSRAGRVTVFDRSWYGRVLVERVEGFASEAEWNRAYAEINDFEDQLVRHGIVLCKFWVHITKEEQLARFKAREGVVYKRWKLTDEDWRNRERWDEYELAVNDMVERTSTSVAPWTLVEGNSKRYSRIKVISTVCDSLTTAIQRVEKAAGKTSGGKNLKRTG